MDINLELGGRAERKSWMYVVRDSKRWEHPLRRRIGRYCHPYEPRHLAQRKNNQKRIAALFQIWLSFHRRSDCK